MPNSKFKYDVFVSYSRKDYVDSHGNVIDGSPIKSIIDFLDQNQISYWFDKEGVYSGREFIELISEAINDSKIMLFVSSENSNSSIYTTGEIFEAIEADRLIIPIKIDDSAYNSKFRLLLRPLDFIDFSQADAFSDLLRAINVEKERIHKREEEELLRKKKDAEEANKKIVKKEIDEYAAEVNRLMVRRHALLDTIYQKQHSIGVDKKSCPVCSTKSDIEVEYCQNCGWTFPTLSSVEGYQQTAENPLLMIARTNYEHLRSYYEYRREKDWLLKENESLKKAIEDLKSSDSAESANVLQLQIEKYKEKVEQLEAKVVAMESSASSSANVSPKKGFVQGFVECFKKHNLLTAILLLASIPLALLVASGFMVSFYDYSVYDYSVIEDLGMVLAAILVAYGNYQLFTFRPGIWVVAPLLSGIIGALFHRFDGPFVGVFLSLVYLALMGLLFLFRKNGQRVITHFKFSEAFKNYVVQFKRHNWLTKFLSLAIMLICPICICILMFDEDSLLCSFIALGVMYSTFQVMVSDRDGIFNLLSLLVILICGTVYIQSDYYLVGSVMLFIANLLLFISLSLSGGVEIWKQLDLEYVKNRLLYLLFLLFTIMLLLMEFRVEL